jgi:hypothetical protein
MSAPVQATVHLMGLQVPDDNSADQLNVQLSFHLKLTQLPVNMCEKNALDAQRGRRTIYTACDGLMQARPWKDASTGMSDSSSRTHCIMSRIS